MNMLKYVVIYLFGTKWTRFNIFTDNLSETQMQPCENGGDRWKSGMKFGSDLQLQGGCSGVGVWGCCSSIADHHSSRKLVRKGAAIAIAGVIAGLGAGFPCRAGPKPGSASGGVNKQLLVPANKLRLGTFYCVPLGANGGGESVLRVACQFLLRWWKSCARGEDGDERGMDIPIFCFQLIPSQFCLFPMAWKQFSPCAGLVSSPCSNIPGGYILFPCSHWIEHMTWQRWVLCLIDFYLFFTFLNLFFGFVLLC